MLWQRGNAVSGRILITRHLNCCQRSYVLIALAVLLIAGLRPCLAEEAMGSKTLPRMTLHIIGFGINQWFPELRSGTDFSPLKTEIGIKWPNTVRPWLCSAGSFSCPAQILLVMPSAEEQRTKTLEQIEKELTRVLLAGVVAATDAGLTEIEIQLVENIDTLSYLNPLNPAQQERVRHWEGAAYRAIGSLHDHLTALYGGTEDSVRVDATMGSNSTSALARNRASWMSYLDSIDLFDGRASMAETIEVIDTVASRTGRYDSIRIFNMHGDYWGGGFLFGPFPSIANASVTDEIKRRRPGTKAFLLTRLGGGPTKENPHIAGMRGREYKNAFFRVEERVADPNSGRVLGGPPRLVQYLQLHNGSMEQTWPDASGARIQELETWAAHVEYLLDSYDLLDELGRLSGLLDESTLPSSLDLLPAILRDAAMYAGGETNPAASHLLELLLQTQFAKVPSTIEMAINARLLPKGFGKLSTLFGLDELAAAAFTRIRQGHLTVDEITHYLDGISKFTAAVAGGLLGGPAGAKLAERLVGHAQWVLRDWTEPLFNAAQNARVRLELVRQWQTLRDRQWAEGQAASYLSEHFGRELLEQLGFSREEIERFDTEVWLGNRRLSAELPPSRCPDGSAPPCTGPSLTSCPDGSAPPCDGPGGGGVGVKDRVKPGGHGHESGVSMNMQVKEESFRNEESDELDALREAAKCRQTEADKTSSCRPEGKEVSNESPPPLRP